MTSDLRHVKCYPKHRSSLHQLMGLSGCMLCVFHTIRFSLYSLAAEAMKHFHHMVLLCTALTAICFAHAQNAYADCSTNFTVLENALLETYDNIFQLTTTYFHPDVENPLYVDVYYNFSGSSTQAHYKWSTASLYLIVAPPALGYLSLFFSYFDETRMGTLTIQLPSQCKGLINVTASTRENFLFVLTQRVSSDTYSIDHAFSL